MTTDSMKYVYMFGFSHAHHHCISLYICMCVCVSLCCFCVVSLDFFIFATRASSFSKHFLKTIFGEAKTALYWFSTRWMISTNLWPERCHKQLLFILLVMPSAHAVLNLLVTETHNMPDPLYTGKSRNQTIKQSNDIHKEIHRYMRVRACGRPLVKVSKLMSSRSGILILN
jgi:hypothetical protein